MSIVTHRLKKGDLLPSGSLIFFNLTNICPGRKSGDTYIILVEFVIEFTIVTDVAVLCEKLLYLGFVLISC
jgi:hypothetical protein